MDEQQLKNRLEAQRRAEDCYGAVTDKGAFVERVMELAGLKRGSTPKDDLAPMDQMEASDFAKTRMFFGRYEGISIRDVPRRYLESFAYDRKGDYFRTMIRRYLNPCPV